MAVSIGSPYGTTTLKYFQDQRNAALGRSSTDFSKGCHFLTIFSPNPTQVLRSLTRDRWLHTPSYTRFNLDSSRWAELSYFYQVGGPGWAPATPPHFPHVPSPLPWGGSDGWWPGETLSLQSASVSFCRAPESAGNLVSLIGEHGGAQFSASLTPPKI